MINQSVGIKEEIILFHNSIEAFATKEIEVQFMEWENGTTEKIK